MISIKEGQKKKREDYLQCTEALAITQIEVIKQKKQPFEVAFIW